MTPAARPRHFRRTRIVCTLGPATDAAGVIEALVDAGMDVARVNLAHGTHAEHAARIDRLRLAANAAARPVAVLADLPGPKFRVGPLRSGAVRLEPWMVVFLAETAGGPECLPVQNPALLHALQPGESVYLSDARRGDRHRQRGARRH